MGPLRCEHSTTPHTTPSDLLSTDVLVSPIGAPVGAAGDGVGDIQYNFRVLYVYTCKQSEGYACDCVASITTKHSCYSEKTLVVRISRNYVRR